MKFLKCEIPITPLMLVTPVGIVYNSVLVAVNICICQIFQFLSRTTFILGGRKICLLVKKLKPPSPSHCWTCTFWLMAAVRVCVFVCV